MRKLTVSFLLLSFLFFSQVTIAEDNAAKPLAPYQPVDMTSSFIKLTVGLGFVVLAIFASAYFFRRIGQIGPMRDGQLKIIGGLNVGNRERIVLLQVGEQQILVGVTQENIRTLHVLDQNIIVDTENKPPLENFSQKLNQALSQWKNRTH